MTQPLTPEPTSGTQSAEADGDTSKSVLVAVASIAVIALAAVLLHWLPIPGDTAASLATASGAVVPLLVLRHRDRKKDKTEKFRELATGRFNRPFLLVLIPAAALVVLLQSAFGTVMALPTTTFSATAQLQGLLTSSEVIKVFESYPYRIVTGVIGTIGLLGVMLPAGIYIAHRIPKYDVMCAIGAVALSQSLLAPLTFLLLEPGMTTHGYTVVEPVQMSTVFLVLASLLISLVAGVLWGRKTRPMFLASRLFRGLSPSDRQAVREMMEDAQSSGRIAN